MHSIDTMHAVLLCYYISQLLEETHGMQGLLEPFNITRYYTDDWGAYERHIDAEKHEIGKANTQKIERKNPNFRTWIKRLTRKTTCFSKLEKMHDIVGIVHFLVDTFYCKGV